MRVILLASVYIGFLGPALSSDAEAQEPLKGIGVAECQTVLDLRENATLHQALSSWVYGFFSALNFQSMNQNYTMRDLSGASMEPDALAERIVGRCYDDPKRTVLAVAFDVFDQLPLVDVSNNR